LSCCGTSLIAAGGVKNRSLEGKGLGGAILLLFDNDTDWRFSECQTHAMMQLSSIRLKFLA
jgi:hypothetical protein